MGVTGLWRLVEPAGKPVPIETLENKVLAVDISIWLHQMVKGYQDAKGAPMANAHLLGLFQRLCKLLYYRIKPVFVFDGAFPELKKETIAKRQDNKAKLNSESERLKREILLLLGKKTTIGSILGKQPSPKKARSDAVDTSDDLFKLPALDTTQDNLSSESESEEEHSSGPAVDLHSIDITSDNFKNLPLREKHDLLIELKETRKMNSWGKLHELPKNSDNFSDYQMNRLLKRRKVQECLEETEKEIGGDTMTLNELETLLNEEGINTNIESLPTKRIASNNTTRYLLISNVKQALENAKKLEAEKLKTNANTDKDDNNKNEINTVTKEELPTSKNDELDEDLQKAIKMSLECDDDGQKQEESEDQSPESSFMLDSDYSDSSAKEYGADFGFESAKAYILQNSDFTSNAIKNIITSAKLPKVKSKNKVDEIMKELDLEEPSTSQSSSNCNNVQIINLENRNVTVELSSSDEECVEVPSMNDYKSNQHEILIVNTTIEDSDVSASENDVISECTHAPETITNNSESDRGYEERNRKNVLPGNKICDVLENPKNDSSSDEDFEEVPDTSSQLMLKPGIELNLEIKDTLEDDIFADVFENSVEEVANKCDKPEKQYETIVTKKDKMHGLINDKSNQEDSKSTEIIKASNVICINSSKSLYFTDATVTQNENDNNFKNVDQITNLLKEQVGSENEEIVSNVNQDKTIEEATTSGAGNVNAISHIINEKEKNPHEQLSTEQLNTMAEQLQIEHDDLLEEKSRLDRMGRNITEEMTKDAQELLQIFGIPYVIAPTEAEAQCAFLEGAKLTDGTITDDSDIWLFGGKTVYKNFFNQKKHVVQFLAERIERSFNLSREQLVLLALLVGSDYTPGVNGVGPVTAMEILAAFCSRRDLRLSQEMHASPAKYAALVTGLQEFKKWVRSGKRTDDTSLRKKLKNVAVADDFPSVRVVQAYMEPKIENSEEKFTWGEPDVTVLRDFTRKKFGWSQNKLDEILKPVLKRLQDRKNQRSMQDYFKRKIEFHSMEDQMSKRVKAAVEKMGPKTNADNKKTDMLAPLKVPKKRKTKAKAKDKLQNDGNEFGDGGGDLGIADQPSTSKCTKSSPVMGIIRVDDIKEISKPAIDIKVPKLARYQEIIPQREKDQINVLQNKMKAIEVFRKTQLDKRGVRKRKINLPKEKADLSESSDSE